jgi:hypothetical protein
MDSWYLYRDSKGATSATYSKFDHTQKGVSYQGIKIYNHLPKDFKDLSSNANKFKLALKKYLLDNSFYCLKKYFYT